MDSARFTGERLSGSGDPEFSVDMERHLAAYRFAATLATGRSVLDAGSGEGYGTALLAPVARRVLGLDRAEAVETAKARHVHGNLEYRAYDLESLDSLGERFDVVMSFQVIEHLVDPPRFLAGLVARVAPCGTLLVTTPNRLMSVSENPYHLREWTADELLALAAPVVPAVRILGVHGSARVLDYERARGEQVRRILRFDRFGLRHLLPEAVTKRAFPRLARLVRRRIGRAGELGPVGAEDFTVRADDVDRALDLLLLAEQMPAS
jgi:SAM-dependent methyltransferase